MLNCEPIRQDSLSCYLFVFHGNVVAIDLVGAGIPLLLSLIFMGLLAVKSGFRIHAHRLLLYALLTVCLGLAVAGEYIFWDSLYGGISIDTRVILYTILLPVGAISFLLLDRARKPKLSIRQVYAVGTVGTVLSDLFRTFSGTLDVSPQIIGAGGPTDGVFLDGLLLILGYMFCAAVYVTYTRRRSAT